MPLIKDHGRQYDVVVFGATGKSSITIWGAMVYTEFWLCQGYTGKLTAEYITTHLSTDLKWAVAGRNESKLKAIVEECKKLNPDRLAPGKRIMCPHL